MESMSRRGKRASRLQWTLGSIMVVVAVFALVAALVRPFVAQGPASGEVISISFVARESRLPGGQLVLGLEPEITITRPADNARHAVSR